jgi:hypothetical protein
LGEVQEAETGIVESASVRYLLAVNVQNNVWAALAIGTVM